jgi:hypothetical protein
MKAPAGKIDAQKQGRWGKASSKPGRNKANDNLMRKGRGSKKR